MTIIPSELQKKMKELKELKKRQKYEMGMKQVQLKEDLQIFNYLRYILKFGMDIEQFLHTCIMNIY